MAPTDAVRMHGLLEQDDRRLGCQRLLRRSRKVCLLSSSWARITSPMYWQHPWTWKLGRSSNCFAWRWRGVRGIRASAPSKCMYVSEWRPSRRVDKKERSCSFLEIGEQKLPFTVSITLLLTWRAFFIPVEVNSPFCRMNIRAGGRG